MSVGLRGTATARPGPPLGPHPRGGQATGEGDSRSGRSRDPDTKRSRGQQCRISVTPSTRRTKHLGLFPGHQGRAASRDHPLTDTGSPRHRGLVILTRRRRGRFVETFLFCFLKEKRHEVKRAEHWGAPGARASTGRGWPGDTATPEQRKTRTRAERCPRPSRPAGHRPRSPLTGTRPWDLTVRHMIGPAPGAPGCDCPHGWPPPAKTL